MVTIPVIKLEKLWDEFIKTQRTEKDITIATVKSYNSDFKIFLSFLSKQGVTATLDKIDKHILKQYFQYLKFTLEYSSSSIRRKVHSLSSFFKYIYKEDYTQTDLMKSIKAPKKTKNLPITISNEDIKILINATDEIGGHFLLRDKVFFLTLFTTGMRRSELIDLRWKDVDFKQSTIKIMKAKGNKQRIIPLLPALKVYLQLLWRSKELDINDYVLHSNAYNKMSTTSAVVLFKKYLKHCNLEDKGYTIHKCRHTVATNLAKTLDSITLAEFLGHEDVNTTKIYVHLNTQDIENKIANTEYTKTINNIIS